MQLVGAVIEEKLNENDSIISENINSNNDNNNKIDSNILKIEDVSSDNESLLENTVIHHVNNNHYEYSPKERPLSKDDMLLLPPLPQSLLLPSRQSSITSVPEIESLNILKEQEEQPLSDLNKNSNSKHNRTIYDLSKALDISDTSYLDMTTSSSVISLSRVHSRNISSVSSTSIPKINTGNRNNNVILSSPTTLPSFSFTQNSSTNSLFDVGHTNTNTNIVPNNNNFSFPSKRFFSMSLSRQNSTSTEGTSTAQTIKSRSRSLSNSNIFRKLNISNPNSLSTGTITNNKTSVPKIKTRHCSMSSPKSKKKNNCLIIGDITTVKELMTFEKIDFHNNDNEQNKYIHKLIDLQKQDDNKFEIILNKISKDLWYSNKEINDLKLQRIQLNDLWAKKINYYQNI